MEAFKKNFITYDENALVQRKVAEKLSFLVSKKLKEKNFNKVIELGCGTGIFTRIISKKINIESLTLNDYFDTRKYLKDINYTNFILGDMNNSLEEKYSLVVSSSSLQWIKDLEGLIQKISFCSDKLFFSIYLENNLKEIKEHFNVSLNYRTEKEILKLLKKYFNEVESFDEAIVLYFEKPLEALRHLKKTGVVLKSRSSVRKIRTFKSRSLSYRVGYFLCSK